MKRRTSLPRAGAHALAVVALLIVTGVPLGLAQTPTDPALQGRLLRRSDGTLYVYLDGMRYPVVPAQLSDDQIDAIPEAGLLVERLSDLFALNATSSPTPAKTATAPTAAPTQPAAPAAPGGQPTPSGAAPPVQAALAALVGHAWNLCGFRGEPLTVTVERADLVAGTDGLPHALLVVDIANTGQRTAQVTAPVHLRDDRGRLYDQSSVGLEPDLTTLARQLGIPSPAPQELPPGLVRRDLWSFIVAPDAQQLSLVPDPLSPCASGLPPEPAGP